jgi:leucyl-tRNA synthetase
VVSAQDIVDRYGSDTARAYILFIGPPEHDADWNDRGVEGMYRFLGRLWRRCTEVAEAAGTDPEPLPGEDLTGDDLELARAATYAVEAVTEDLDGSFAFNTAIAEIMKLTNACYDLRDGASLDTQRFALATAASLLFPFAPHTAADAYHRLTGRRVWEEPWPAPDLSLLERPTYTLVCQVNGKVRDRVEAATGASEEELLALCLSAPNVQAHVDGKEVVKRVVVPGKLVNVVAR